MIPQRHPWLLACVPQAIANVLYVADYEYILQWSILFCQPPIYYFSPGFQFKSQDVALLQASVRRCGIETKQKHSNLLECGL